MNAVRIGVLFPTTFNLNADAANATVIARRLRLSGIDTDIVPLDLDAVEERNPVDALVIGSPSSSTLVSAEVTSHALRRYIAESLAREVPTLAISNGMHLLGTMTTRDGVDIGGLDIFPLTTVFGGTQHVAIGAQILTEWGTAVGIENHNATVRLGGGVSAFGTVLHGTGNGVDDVDGIVSGSLWGTHLHGPLFALNPAIADEFARRVTRYAGTDFVPGVDLEMLDQLALNARLHLIRKKSA